VLAAVAGRSSGALTAAERSQLEGAIKYFATAAPRHTDDEELSLFPRLRASRDPAARAALETVALLESDHDAAAVRHSVVDVVVRHWLDEGRLADADRANLRDQLAALKAMYDAHIAVEDRELFPAAAAVLSGEEISEIGREMERRRRT
jgi:hemerythrin-like domain-containing protein